MDGSSIVVSNAEINGYVAAVKSSLRRPLPPRRPKENRPALAGKVPPRNSNLVSNIPIPQGSFLSKILSISVRFRQNNIPTLKAPSTPERR